MPWRRVTGPLNTPAIWARPAPPFTRWLIALAFFFIAIRTITDPAGLSSALVALKWASAGVAPYAVPILVVAELTAALLLLSRSRHRVGAAVGAFLLTGFACITGDLWDCGLAAGQGCVGILLKLHPSIALILDFALLGICVALVRSGSSRQSEPVVKRGRSASRATEVAPGDAQGMA